MNTIHKYNNFFILSKKNNKIYKIMNGESFIPSIESQYDDREQWIIQKHCHQLMN
jgi:hypothetical protein